MDQEDATQAPVEVGDLAFELVFDSSPLGMAIMDGHGRFGRVNPALCTLLGREADWLVGRPAVEVTLEQDVAATREAIALLNSGPSGTSAVLRKRYRRADRSVVQARVTAVRLPDSQGCRRTLAQVEDLTAQEQHQRELQRMATHDALTGLPGRAVLLDRLERLLEDPRRDTGRHVAVAFLDLDRFKAINDALGHAAGDAVLTATARRLAAAAGEDDLVARLSGDEFVVLSSGVPDLQAAADLVTRLQAAVSSPVPYADDEVLVTASVGLALCSARETSVGELLANADAAMYEAKRRGARRFEVFDQAMRERARTRARVAALLSAAVTARRVLVHYQPIVALPGRRVVGVEALLRVVDVDGRVLSPPEFLDVAVETGTLRELERLLLAQAAAQVQQWRTEFGTDLRLSVNVCAASVNDGLGPSVRRALQGSGLAADRLTLELTEQVLIDSGPEAASAVTSVVALGAQVVVDDFGVGWGSLTYLRAFPVTGLKIDRSFVEGLHGSGSRPDSAGDDDLVIVEALTDLGRRLHLQVTAEGVETEAQLQALVSSGCPQGQGYLFGRPVAEAELERLLSSP